MSTRKARYRVNLINRYRELTGRRTLTGQYITMAGELSFNGRLQDTCEPIQLIEAGFLRPRQYIGIENDSTRHDNNVLACAAVPELTLLYGDFSGVCARLAGQGLFNPGFLVLDTNWQPPRVIDELTYLWPLLKRSQRPAVRVIALNIVMAAKGRVYRHECVVDGLQRSGTYLEMLSFGWRLSPRPYRYSGTEGSQKGLRMSTYFLTNAQTTTSTNHSGDHGQGRRGLSQGS